MERVAYRTQVLHTQKPGDTWKEMHTLIQVTHGKRCTLLTQVTHGNNAHSDLSNRWKEATTTLADSAQH